MNLNISTKIHLLYLFMHHYVFLWKKKSLNGPLETIVSNIYLLLYGAVSFSIKPSNFMSAAPLHGAFKERVLS